MEDKENAIDTTTTADRHQQQQRDGGAPAADAASTAPLRSPQSRIRLAPALLPGNLDKTMSAPVTVIVAYDPKFYDYLPRLFPHADAKPWFTSNPELAAETAIRNGTLQGAYFMLAARALGFGLGPMSGFDTAKVDAEFLSDRGWKSNFLVNLGHGDPAAEKPRGPRFWFDETCLML